jgi:hypothetical protein
VRELLAHCERDLEPGAGLAVDRGNDKVVLHTTETPRGSLDTVRNLWRGKNNWGRGLCHVLVDGARRVQCLPLDVNAYTLENKPGGIDPNRSGHTIQVEVVGYAEQGWDDETYQSVGELIGDLMTAGLRLDLDQCPRFLGPADQAYLATYLSANRLVIVDWPGFNGICGHQHIKEQAHWDPGPIDIHRLCEIARHHCQPEGDAIDMATIKELETIVHRVSPYFVIVDGRTVTAWLVAGLHKRWLPSNDYTGMLTAFAETGRVVQDVGMQGPGSPWIAILDLCEQVGPGPP